MLDTASLGLSNLTLASIYVSRELFGLMQYWARKVIQLEEKKFKRISLENQGQLDDLAIAIANRY